MTSPLILDGSTPKLPAPAAGGERARLGEAAEQFEAIFLRQMLAAARNAEG